MATFDKVTPGDPFRMPANLYNRLVDVALKADNFNQIVVPSTRIRQTGIIKVRNDSGANRERFEVLGLTSPLITPTDNLDQFQQEIALAGEAPSSTPGRYAILIEPILSGQIGRAVVQGVTQCKINVSDTSHKFAESASGDTAKLVSAATGSARILWAESGTGEKWAVVRMPARAQLATCHICTRSQFRVDFDTSILNSDWLCYDETPSVTCDFFKEVANRTITYDDTVSDEDTCYWLGPLTPACTAPSSHQGRWLAWMETDGIDVAIFVQLSWSSYALFATVMPIGDLDCDSNIVVPYDSGETTNECNMQAIPSVTLVPI